MIALDSNVVLRFLINDGSPQCAVAARFVEQELSGEQPGFISLVVACEVFWVMDRSYKLKSGIILKAFKALLAARQIRFERETMLAAVIVQLMKGGLIADFADAIIHSIGDAEGCSHTVTFDTSFAGLKGVQLVV